MGILINIDNGGTLTDFCAVDGAKIWRTKTLTTPHDLSQCLMDGLGKMSNTIFGSEDIESLLLATDHIRYSTTQGTNALVERKGPRLGLIVAGRMTATVLRDHNSELFDALVADRHTEVTVSGDETRMDAVRAVSNLVARGANRVVVSVAGTDAAISEHSIKRGLLKAFPAHLLGAVPILFSRDLAGDDNDMRRTWTALFNAFLHPAMERFLYAAEHKLRAARSQKPLLIFRNDGQSARVAKTVAIKTYSSGPRGGADGARQLATHYRIAQLISVDIGGTTTDVSVVNDNESGQHRYGQIEGVETCFPLADVVSFGAGGSSIINVAHDALKVGPESVGSTPGPACFGLGGTAVTITDVFFAGGLLDAASYFGGSMKIDLERATAAIVRNVAEPMKLAADAAMTAMEEAWASRVADGIKTCVTPGAKAVLAAFGGAGPFMICRIAEKLGINHVIIPKLAAVFSAFGIGFSNIGHDYELPLSDTGSATAVIAKLRQKAHRGMIAESIDPLLCKETLCLIVRQGDQEDIIPITGDSLPQISKIAQLALKLNITHVLPRPLLTGQFDGAEHVAHSSAKRIVLFSGVRQSVPLYRLENLATNAGATGPCVLEEEFFTCRVDPDWRFETSDTGDILLSYKRATL